MPIFQQRLNPLFSTQYLSLSFSLSLHYVHSAGGHFARLACWMDGKND